MALTMRPASTTLILIAFMSLPFPQVLAKGLGFHMDRTQENPYDELVCFLTTDHTDSIIFSIVDISITNFTDAEHKVRLASASALQPEACLDHVTTDITMKASGSVSRYYARLRVRVEKHSGCELGNYLCEVTYMNMAGSTDKIHAVVNVTFPDVIGGKRSDQSELFLMSQIKELRDESAIAVGVLANRSDEIARRLKHLSDRLDSHVDVRSGQRRIAFSAALSYDLTLDVDNVVVYGAVDSNEGDAYDVKTGIFTAPVSGSYMFHFHALTQNDGEAFLKLYQNQQYRASLYAKVNDHYAHGAGSVILALQEGDTVYIKTAKESKLYGRGDDRYTSFSGFLI